MLHLLHPAFVHFSVAFLVFGAISEVIGVLAVRERAERLGSLLVQFGTVSLLLSIMTGYLAANTVDLPTAAESLLWSHERNGWIMLGLFFAALFWKAWHQGELPRGQQRGYLVLLLAGAAMVLYNAYLGGLMVYGHGVGVFD